MGRDKSDFPLLAVSALKSSRGFSLVEIIIVVMIIAIISAVAIPFLMPYMVNRDLKNSARDIIGDFFELKHSAISTGRVHRIDFSVADNSYKVFRCDADGQGCAFLYLKSPAAFRSDIRFDPANPPAYSGGLPRITFLPRGTALMGSLHLINSRGSTAKLTTQITGRTHINWTLK
jgi:prepilin-type N-terminal cleavage/methylation domain-containing protein